MDPTSREHLSALMDGELAAEPTRFLLRRLEHDPDLGATWSRWHLIRACLAEDAARMSAPRRDSDFAARVGAALLPHASVRAAGRRWAHYVGGTAIAASVAVAALMFTPPGTEPAALATSPAPLAPAFADRGAASTALAPVPAWLRPNQPAMLNVQPAAANFMLGTGLMQPDYIRRAAYSQGYSVPLFDANASPLPFVLVMAPVASASAAGAPH